MHFGLGHGKQAQPSGRRAYLCQHNLGVVEVAQHGLDVGLIGRPGQEPPGEALHALHGGSRQV